MKELVYFRHELSGLTVPAVVVFNHSGPSDFPQLVDLTVDPTGEAESLTSIAYYESDIGAHGIAFGAKDFSNPAPQELTPSVAAGFDAQATAAAAAPAAAVFNGLQQAAFAGEPEPEVNPEDTVIVESTTPLVDAEAAPAGASTGENAPAAPVDATYAAAPEQAEAATPVAEPATSDIADAAPSE